MNKMLLPVLLLSLSISSCSSLKRSMISGALIGGVVGASGGMIFSPEEESRNKNGYIFGILGAGVGTALTYLFSDEGNKKLKETMILDSPIETHKEVPLFDFSEELKNIRPEVSFKPIKKFEVPQEKLPPELEGKVKKQFIIEYESEARTLEIDNRTIQISPFKAWEHVYEK